MAGRMGCRIWTVWQASAQTKLRSASSTDVMVAEVAPRLEAGRAANQRKMPHRTKCLNATVMSMTLSAAVISKRGQESFPPRWQRRR